MKCNIKRRTFIKTASGSIAAVALAQAGSRAAAGTSSAWRAEGADYHFQTDVVSGRYLTAGKYQGMRSLVHRPTGVEIASGEKLPGLVAPYRVFGNGKRYGDVRDRATKVELIPEGMRITHPADEENPFDIISCYSWEADTLEVRYTVKLNADMKGFEMGVASYLSAGFRAFVSRQSNNWGEKGSKIVPVDVNPMTDVYALFPRDETVMKTVFDGRWDLPPYPVRYAVPAYFAVPLAYRRHVQSGVMAIGMGDPKECYAICIPVNNPPENPDPANGYQGIYFYLFGKDMNRGETASAHIRWVIGKDISEQEILRRWESFAGGK